MEALLSLQNDITALKNKPLGEVALEKELYEVLIGTGREIIATIGKAVAFRKSMTFHKELDLLLEEVSECLEEIHEIYAHVIEAPYKTIRLKRLFESLDEVMGGIDDFIESVNELFEAQGFKLDYIESWDVGFFIDHM